MSITSRAKTRPLAAAIVAALAAHADFAALITAGKLAVIYLPSLNSKLGLDTRLDQRVAKISGMLITVTPARGTNTAKGNDRVSNDTALAVNVWSRPTIPDEALPEPLDMLDEVQRVLAEMQLAFPAAEGLSGSAKPPAAQLRVGNWVEVPDPTYLNHEIQITCLIPLGKSNS